MIAPDLALPRRDIQRLLGLLGGYESRPGSAGPLAILSDKLLESQELDPQEVPPDLVTMHSRVLLRDADSNETLEVTLVFPHAAEPGSGAISVLAPLGMTIFGACVGDIAEIRLPTGVRRWRIEALMYQPEAAGDYDL